MTAGIEDASVAQFPAKMSELGVDALVKAVHGETVPSLIDSGRCPGHQGQHGQLQVRRPRAGPHAGPHPSTPTAYQRDRQWKPLFGRQAGIDEPARSVESALVRPLRLSHLRSQARRRSRRPLRQAANGSIFSSEKADVERTADRRWTCFFPSSRQIRYAGVMECFTDTAGTRASGSGAAVAEPSSERDALIFVGEHDRQHARRLRRIGRVLRAELEVRIVVVDLPEDALPVVIDSPACGSRSAVSLCVVTPFRCSDRRQFMAEIDHAMMSYVSDLSDTGNSAERPVNVVGRMSADLSESAGLSSCEGLVLIQSHPAPSCLAAAAVER